ncbi:MAG: hypothetical protein EOP11_27365 [Proteobacteria bacterium]|nr:MAG: hypothetical protein EOP11_27365 [Pseudomonadota bacterium]
MHRFLILALLPFSIATAFADGSHYDRALNPAELAKLLPEYVRFVDERAESLPSPQDNQRLRMLAAAIADPTFGTFVAQEDGSEKLVGHQSYTLPAILEQVEAEVAAIKATTPDERRNQVADFLSGFKGERSAGKIGCRLGYFSEGQHPIDRIVKCTDDRGQKPAKGREGITDTRDFILSIDVKTLKPVGVISLEMESAG